MMRCLSFLLAFASTSAFTAPSPSGLSSKASVVPHQVGWSSSVSSPLFRRTVTEDATSLCALPETFTELPEKLYLPKEKEVPKVLGGLQIGLRKMVCITGASSGLGLSCADALVKTGRYFVICAVRDPEKMKKCKYSRVSRKVFLLIRLTCLFLQWPKNMDGRTMRMSP